MKALVCSDARTAARVSGDDAAPEAHVRVAAAYLAHATRSIRPVFAALVTLTSSAAHAFVAQGHRVIESHAYKMLGVQGCDDGAGRTIPGEQVLRELRDAGLLDTPAYPGGPSDCSAHRLAQGAAGPPFIWNSRERDQIVREEGGALPRLRAQRNATSKRACKSRSRPSGYRPTRLGVTCPISELGLLPCTPV